jgi:hypothetical protein
MDKRESTYHHQGGDLHLAEKSLPSFSLAPIPGQREVEGIDTMYERYIESED